MAFCLEAFYLEQLSVCQLTFIELKMGIKIAQILDPIISFGAFRGSQEYGLIHVEAQH